MVRIITVGLHWHISGVEYGIGSPVPEWDEPFHRVGRTRLGGTGC